MRGFKRRHYKLLRHLPRRKHLRGGRLHRLLGDRIFDADLWKPSRDTVARGLALGLFIGFSPTMGVQIILAGVAAYFLKVNLPVALLGSLVTNPFTAAIVYPLEYQLGVWLIGVPEQAELEGYAGTLRSFARYAKPLWIGSLVAGGVTAALAYGLVMLLWKKGRGVRQAVQHRADAGNSPPAPKDVVPGAPDPKQPDDVALPDE